MIRPSGGGSDTPGLTTEDESTTVEEGKKGSEDTRPVGRRQEDSK